MKYHFPSTLCFIFTIFLLSFSLVASDPIATRKTRNKENVIGFLEEEGGKTANNPIIYRIQVRLCFNFNGYIWKSYDQMCLSTLPKEDLDAIEEAFDIHKRDWIAIKKGEEKGRLLSAGLIFGRKTPVPIGWLQNVIPQGQDFSEIMGPRTSNYSGWQGIPVKRPLLLVSKTFYRNTEGWRLSSEINGNKVPSELLGFMQLKKFLSPVGVDVDIPTSNTLNSLRISETYTSKIGKHLYRLTSLSTDNSYWIVESSKTHFSYLGKNMQLLETGDFDGDGYSEFLFWFEGYAQDGYVLIWGNFTRASKCLWNWG